MNSSLYEIMNMKGNSIFKSVFLSQRHNDTHSNVKVDIEAYDDTFINAYAAKGEDYIFQQLEKKMQQEQVQNEVCKALGLNEFTGALVTIYADTQTELYLSKEGTFNTGARL